MNNPSFEMNREVGIQYSNNSNVYQKGDFSLSSLEIFQQQMIDASPDSLHMKYLHDTRLMQYCGLAQKKEWVFDIDLTDYHRFCDCKKETKEICQICWLHIEGSVFILHDILCNQLAVPEKNILWQFSGGRGVHCLVNSAVALSTSNQDRARVITLTSPPPKELIETRPALVASLETHFVLKVIKKRRLLERSSFVAYCLEIINRCLPLISSTIERAWSDLDNGETSKRYASLDRFSRSEVKWKILKQIETQNSTMGSLKPSQLILLGLYIPRIDPAPMNLDHQSRVPFSIHQKTGCIALPVTSKSLIEEEYESHRISLNSIIYGRTPSSHFINGLQLLRTWTSEYNT